MGSRLGSPEIPEDFHQFLDWQERRWCASNRDFAAGKPCLRIFQSVCVMTFREILFIVPFFFISFFALRPTVPAFDGTWVAFWAALGALGMTMTAWIAMHMFKVIVADEKRRKAESRTRQ